MKKFLALALAAMMLLALMVPAYAEEQVLTGTADGRGGPVTVTLTVADGKITDVQVDAKDETPGIGTLAVEQLPPQIIAAQTLKLDAVSSATITSAAILAAAEEALKSGGLDPANFMGEAAPAEKAEDAVYDVDVVVIGAGGAGMTAAITAADAGAKVLVFESTGCPGGNSVRSP